ncbi:MAG: hypothetical protein ACFFB0_18200 [Promethearchaeota archaeon]
MSLFYFHILILGDPETIHFYVSRAFEEPGEEKESYFSWLRQVKVVDNVCDLEIDVVESFSANLDEIIEQVDGIIYFLNPSIKEEFEFFQMILPDIFAVKRDLPTIIIFYDQNGILPFSVNELLENVWINYPSLEAFVNLGPKEFYQALRSLCQAIINGDNPINLENAWMRFPIFIEMANIYFENKNYYYAAQAIRKAALIAEIYKKEEFYIITEQTAFLYSKINLYLEASKILENIDKKKSYNYKKLYAEAMITDGNRLFNKNKYEKAARMYEQAAQWSSIESIENSLIDEAFRLSVSSWISACKVEDAFRILESLPHKTIIMILREIVDKIVAEGEYLISSDNFELAREQLYRAINRYQREDLFEELKKLTLSLTNILIKIFKNQVKQKDSTAAKNTYDELENMWQSYKVEKKNLDSTLKTLINTFLEENNFGMATVFINKLDSLKLKQDLTKLSSKYEDEYKKQLKKETEEIINKGINILRDYANSERDIIAELNTKIIKEANKLIEQKGHIKAAIHLKHQADYLKKIGKDEIRDQILTRSLDILLEGKNFEEFFTYFEELSISMKRNYLIRIYPIYIESLKEIKESDKFERNKEIFKNSNRIFRNLMFYDESREISQLFIKVIKQEALRILEEEEDISGINKATELVKNVLEISSSYLEKEQKIKVSFNKIYKKIAEIYIEMGDLPNAQSYNDRITNKEYKTEIHEKIAILEEKERAARLKKVEESRKGETLKEELSIIENRGREALLDKNNELKERKALKKAYFEGALLLIKNEDYEKAIEIYKKLVIQFNRTKKYKLASVCLAIASLLLIKENRFIDIKKFLNDTKKELSSLGRLFVDTYPVTLIEYISDVKEYQDESKFKESLHYFENLPLFEEELIVLYDLLGKEYKAELKPEKTIETIAEIENIKREIKKIADSIEKEKEDVARRKLMKNQYWKLALENISKNKLTNVSLSYLDTITKLVDKKFLKQAAISLIMGSLILINEKNVEVAEETFEKHLKKSGTDFRSLQEIQIMKFLFSAIKKDDLVIKNLIIDSLIEKLVLFDPEIKILKSILSEEAHKEEIEKEELSRKQIVKLSTLRIEMDQIFGKIQSKMGDIRQEKDDIFNKRNVMKNRYYRNILDLLNSKTYKEAGLEYLRLAETLAKRKDLSTGSLLILLHGLSLLKAGVSLKIVKSNTDNFLNSLGIKKELVKDTFYIMLILFLFDVKTYKLEIYLSKIREMLEILPLFEEEKRLIEIED